MKSTNSGAVTAHPPEGHRLRRLAMVSVFLCCVSLLQACVDESRRDLPPWVSTRTPAAAPMHIRTLGADQQFSELAADTVARGLPSDAAGAPLRILALSGGGASGAFGAGALVGMSRAGERPEFAVVTGVSTGALIAPYAFLGSGWDDELAASYSSGAGAHILRLRGLGAVFGSSVYEGAPLAKLIDHYVSDELLQAVAAEAAKGRLLLVATTNVDSGEPVIWDLGSIARYGGANAHDLFRDVLVASASVPGMFPPVVMHVHKEGQTYDEAHVDGAVTLPFFVAPEFAAAAQDAAPLRHTSVFVLIDGSIDELPQADAFADAGDHLAQRLDGFAPDDAHDAGIGRHDRRRTRGAGRVCGRSRRLPATRGFRFQCGQYAALVPIRRRLRRQCSPVDGVDAAIPGFLVRGGGPIRCRALSGRRSRTRAPSARRTLTTVAQASILSP